MTAAAKNQQQGVSRATEGYKLLQRFAGPGQENGPEEVSNVQVAVHVFETTPAEVLYEAGATINMGNYESGRVTVGIRVPCYREEIATAFDTAKVWVEKVLEDEVRELRRAGV
jgi:hypothetical protein